MTDLRDIYRQQIDYCRNSGIEVTTDSPYSTVAIAIPDTDGVFMQGDEADAFIAEVERLWEDESLDLTMEEAELIAAYPYADICA